MNSVVGRWEFIGLLVATAALESFLSVYVPWALYFDLPLAAVLYLGWHSPPARGAAAGTLFGLTQDIVELAPFWGLNGFSKTIAGFVASYLSKWLISEAFAMRAMAIFAVSLLDGATVFGLMEIFGPDRLVGLWRELLVKAVATGILGAAFFWIYDRVKFPEKDFRKL